MLDAKDTVRFYAPGDAEGLLLKNKAMVVTELDYALNHFVGCIEKDSLPESDLDDNYQSFAMVCAAEESIRQRTFVRVLD